ncbi:hypothetical protein Tco_0327118 [Tanacetum coccineum]
MLVSIIVSLGGALGKESTSHARNFIDENMKESDVKLFRVLRTINIDQVMLTWDTRNFMQNELRKFVKPRQQSSSLMMEDVTLQSVTGTANFFATGHHHSDLTSKEQVEAILRRNKELLFVQLTKRRDHMIFNKPKPKRKRYDSWFKDKVLLVQAQANGQILHEKELAFLANPEDYRSALAEVNNHDYMDNNMINQALQAMPSSE